MFPDLRILISATVATFFLAATAGLYASLRITQDQIAARAEARTTIEDNPIARISAAWPLPETGRTAALRELEKIAKASPIASEESAAATDRDNTNAVPSGESHTQPASNDHPAKDAAGSTGIAARTEPANPDTTGNISGTPAIDNADAKAEKEIRQAAKRSLQLLKKKSVRMAQRRKRIARVPEHLDPVSNGYPLYLTVPVTN